jgi:uracil-DNA glycosylase family 4
MTRKPPASNTPPDRAQARALLEWYAASGVDVAVSDSAVNRYAEPAANVTAMTASPVMEKPLREEKQHQPAPASPRPPAPARTAPPANVDQALADAEALARAATTLEELRAAIEGFTGLSIRDTAKNTVFADGTPDAPLMLIGEAPGRDEDLQGLPFVGASGQLLDRMLKAIGHDRRRNAYISNILPWRPPGNRTPTAEEAMICMPFLKRHIELVAPRVIVLLGGVAAKHILNTETGIMRLRGRWQKAALGGLEIDVMPTFHPAYLLRQPGSKREAWLDFLAVKAYLEDLCLG